MHLLPNFLNPVVWIGGLISPVLLASAFFIEALFYEVSLDGHMPQEPPLRLIDPEMPIRMRLWYSIQATDVCRGPFEPGISIGSVASIYPIRRQNITDFEKPP